MGVFVPRDRAPNWGAALIMPRDRAPNTGGAPHCDQRQRHLVDLTSSDDVFKAVP